MARQPRQDLGEDMALDGDATGGGREAGAGEVPEDRAAAPALHRPVVPAELDDHIIEMILALKALLGLAGRLVDQAVVATVLLIVAPGVARPDPLQRKQSPGTNKAIGPVEQAAQRQISARGAAIALAFHGTDA